MWIGWAGAILLPFSIGITGTGLSCLLLARSPSLFFQIAAADDLNTGQQHSFLATPITVSPANVDYTATTFTHTGPLVPGGPISESFTLQNIGTDSGSLNVQWTVYVSTDSLTTISAGDTPVSAGTTGLLGASPASRIIGFTGTWPSAHGPYYLKVKLSAPDDINTANDIQASTVYTTTFVDYTVNSVTSTGPYLAIRQRQLHSSERGKRKWQTAVGWNAYVSTNATLDAGDTLVASGTTGHPCVAGVPIGLFPSQEPGRTRLEARTTLIVVGRCRG